MLKQLVFSLLVSTPLCSVPVQAHTPVEFMEVLEGVPSNLIEHDIELKSVLDTQRMVTELAGPYHFSLAVSCMGRDVKTPKAYLSWYKIVDPKSEASRKILVVDLVRGDDKTALTIESAEYFLSPAQRITAGPPSAIPHGLDHYKAYRIVGAASRELDVELGKSDGPTKRRVGKPLFVCVPAEEWHHDDHFPASHPQACFVVYELDPQDHSGQISLIDQFGLNQIRTSKSRWLCVSAMLSTKSTD